MVCFPQDEYASSQPCFTVLYIRWKRVKLQLPLYRTPKASSAFLQQLMKPCGYLATQEQEYLAAHLASEKASLEAEIIKHFQHAH